MSHQLNSAQREAVETLNGPLLVLAGAGTGKTRVVTYRIANLIRHGTRPERILAVTFTKKAAAEMQSRAAELLGRKTSGKARCEISTFHSLCVRILRRHIRRLGYPEHFAIYDRTDQESLARNVLREIRVSQETLRPGDLLAAISRWKCAAVRPPQAEAAAGGDREHLAAIGYRRYQNALRAAGAVDFDDLLLLVEELFRRFGDVRRDEAARFDHLLIDEYQDTNASQYEIVKSLAAGHRNLCVVGDDDQSIYGWRGAEVAHILRFRRDWPEAKVVRLEENYRSTAEILALANRLIAFNRTRHDKTLRAVLPGGERPRILQLPDETAEAQEVVASIRRRIAEGAAPRDIAVLLRTNEQPRPFEQELRKHKVPYVLIGGMSFYDRREVRDVLAYLKLLATPGDEMAALRIINTPPRGIGQATVAALMDHAVAERARLWDVLPRAADVSGVTPPAAEAIERFRQLVERHRERLEGEPPSQVVRSLIHQINYRSELERRYPEAGDVESRWTAVEEVVNSLAAYEQQSRRPSLIEFLDEATLSDRDQEDEKENQLRRNAVVLMTLHSAKGLEFPEVYLVGMEEGLLPHHRAVEAEGDAIEEERRLCYVGVTRAQKRLTLTLALARRKWGRLRPTDASRFLFEMIGTAEQADAHRTASKPAAAKPRRISR
jgi:DNA helicase II / ATP-dependent DNA helicase PcrA